MIRVYTNQAPVLRLRLEHLDSLPEDALLVLAGVWFAADVNPFGGAFRFETKLVEGDVVDEPVEDVRKLRHHDVGGFAGEVLGVGNSAYGLV